MNRAQLVSSIRDYLNRPTLPDAAISTFISVAEGVLNRELRHPRQIQRVSVTLTDDSTTVLSLPSDLMQLLTVSVNDVMAVQVPAMAREAAPAGQCYIERGDCIELLPAAASGTVIDMDYRGALVPLTEDASENWLSRLFPGVYLYACLREAAVYLKDDPRLQSWTARYAEELEAVNAQGWGQNIGDAPRVVLADD